jgi:hypothetical protein
MKQRMVLGLSALALSLLSLTAVAPAGADAKTTVCKMNYALKGWSAFYKTSSGWGTIICDHGQTAPVKITTKGGGFTAGKSEIRDGHGKFSEVRSISELYGSYASVTAAAGAVKSSEAQAMTKGEVSLALAGTGTGVELGLSFNKFTISRR